MNDEEWDGMRDTRKNQWPQIVLYIFLAKEIICKNNGIVNSSNDWSNNKVIQFSVTSGNVHSPAPYIGP